MTTFVLEAANLSIHRTKFIKTGIQEAVFQTLKHVASLRKEFPEVRILALPRIPLRLEKKIAPFEDLSAEIIEAAEVEMNLNSEEIWGFDLKKMGYSPSIEFLWNTLRSADYVHFQSLINVGPLAKRMAKPRFSITVYDLVPHLFPEFQVEHISEWYSQDYLPAIGAHIQHAICISRHTALDLLENPTTSRIPRVSYLPWPIETPSKRDDSALLRFRLPPKNYVLFVGSLEPRKNIESLLDGFELYKSRNPSSSVKLVLVGSTGWKNASSEQRLKSSPNSRDIVRTGYVSDAELHSIIAHAAAVGMPSFYEGFGIPVANATSLGVPVITTLGSSLPEACLGRGVFVEPSDPESMCAGIHIALSEYQQPQSFEALKHRTWLNYAKELLTTILSR
jgi:glycosyltransferase involved in cell wall biosynthesis